MAFDVSKPADTDKLRISAGLIRDNWVGLTDALGSSLKLGLESQNIWIYADSISGETASLWTLQSSLGDTVLAIKGGSTYTTGGTTAGTWTQPSHTLTINEIPAHTHTMSTYTDISAAGARTVATAGGGSGATTASTGGGQGHNHGNTWRPSARVGLIIQKN